MLRIMCAWRMTLEISKQSNQLQLLKRGQSETIQMSTLTVCILRCGVGKYRNGD